MGVAMKQFIDRFKAMEKIANETLAANPEALVGVDSLPGSEHDKKVPEEAKKPDEEVTQGQPSGATTASGAVNGGDAKPLNEGKLEMDQPLLNAEQKPLVTDDALTAKTANAHLASLVGDLLKDLSASSGTKKEAQCGGGEGATHTAVPEAPKKTDEKKDDEEDGKGGEKKAGEERTTIRIDNDLLNKIAAAQAVFMAGREAAEKAIQKKAEAGKAEVPDVAKSARAIIKAACVKAAQESGLSEAEANAAADNAMAAAGMADASAADAGAAEAAAADAGAGAQIPPDVTEDELATAIVDLVSSGELDPDTAKAIVEEIAGEQGGATPTEDEAAEIIANGIESGQITPEQAQQIAAAVEGDAAAADAGAAAADAGAASAEAQGASDAAAAIQDAKDEAQGAADAEAAMKSAAEHIRGNALAKVANAIVANRNEKEASAKEEKEGKEVPGSKILQKVASIIKTRQEAKNQESEHKDEAQKQASAEEMYLAGFKKKAEEMGVDPAALARYICERSKAAQPEAK